MGKQTSRARRDLTEGSLTWNLVRLAVPTAAVVLLQFLYSLVDVFWLSRLEEIEEVAVSAPGLTGPLFWIVVSIGMGLGTGGAALVSQYAGALRHDEADVTAAQTMLITATVMIVLAVPMVLFAPAILRAWQAPAEAIPVVVPYMRVFLMGLPAVAVTVSYMAVLRALGDTLTVGVIVGAANLLNAILDPFLIFGWWGMPNLGVTGAAVATLASQVVAAALCVGSLRIGRAGLRLTLGDFRPRPAQIRQILKVGVPAAIASSSNSLGFGIFQGLINSLGTTVVAAFTVGSRITNLINAPMHIVAQSVAPVVGQALGAGKVPLARKAVRRTAAIFAALLIGPVAVLSLKGDLVARFFLDTPDAVKETVAYFRVVPWSTYCFGVLVMLMAAFYGSGHTRAPMVVSLIRVWVVRLPVAFLLVRHVGLGSTGAYGGMVAGNIAAAGLALLLFLRGGWETALVPVRGADEEPTAQDG
jgi:putative MATE family efflux protein